MEKTKKIKKGISLIVLVITIIVVIIIAASVILTLTNNNPIEEARKATFLNDISTFQDELNMYKTNEYAKRMGEYDPNLLIATSSGLTYNGASVSGQDNIYDVIPSLEGKSKYSNEFEVSGGAIKYTGTNTERSDWAQNDAGIISDSAKPAIEITTSNLLPVKSGTSVIYNIAMTSSVAMTTTNLSGNIKILNNSGVELGTQPSINIGSVTGTTTEKNATITINTTGMAEGIYKIKLLGEAVKTASQGNLEAISNQIFEIDNTAPSMPTISISPTGYTTGNVTVTITKANVSDTLEYSTNGTTWLSYTTSLTITNNSTVYARETDGANNVSNQATQIITNIDATVPANATMSLTSALEKINGTITISDTGSGINVSQSKYIVTTQSTAYGIADAAWNSAIVMGTTSKTISETTTVDGSYYVQVLSVDNAGNKKVNVSSQLVVITKTPASGSCALDGSDFTNSPQTLTWLDRTSYANNATVSNFAYNTTSGSDNAKSVVFDGVNDYLTINKSITNNFSMGILFKCTNSSNVSNSLININPDKYFSLGINASNNNLQWGIGNGSSFLGGGSTIIPSTVLNKWCYINVVMSNSNITIYFNGTAIYSGAGATFSNYGSQFYVGKLDSSYSRTYFNGSIGSIALYDRALSAAEINSLYEAYFKYKIT